jgi:hypothetical protein
MSKTKLEQKTIEIQHLDTATQAIIHRIDKNDRRLRLSAYSFMSVLLIVGVIGIFYQNHLANQNKQHIDCIVKLFTTPAPSGTKLRFIQNPSRTCNIKFSS